MNTKPVYVLICLLGIALAACSFSKNSDDKTSGKTEVVIKDQSRDGNSLVDNDFEAKIDSKADSALNEYFVRVTWKAGKESRVKIYKNKNFEKPLVTIDTTQEKNYYDIQCISGNALSISIDAYAFNSSNETVKRKEFIFTCPTDLEISGTTVFNPDMHPNIGKIFFHRDSTLLLQGNNLNTSIGTLIVDEYARIETYEKYTDLRNEGKTPVPFINLDIEKVLVLPQGNSFGKLEILLRGLDGKNGRQPSESEVTYQNYLKEKSLKRDGDNGRAGIVKTRMGGSFPVAECAQTAQNGSDGRDGFPGIDGEDGFDGMNSPALKIIFRETTNLFVDIKKIPGRKGLGSIGLPAIPPGKGGEGGQSDPICGSSGSNGSSGVTRADGKNGKDGKDGSESDVYVNERANSQVRSER